MAEVIVTAAAEAEYLESLRWYAERSQRAAQGFEAAFDQALRSIASEPGRFARCDSRHRALLMRRYPFQIVYREEGDRIVINAVAHAKRRPRYWSGRRKRPLVAVGEDDDAAGDDERDAGPAEQRPHSHWRRLRRGFEIAVEVFVLGIYLFEPVQQLGGILAGVHAGASFGGVELLLQVGRLVAQCN
jgi:plasmid stabilization system protein ParE